jgi:hypothetical protein
MEHAQDAPGEASVNVTATDAASVFMPRAQIIGAQAPGRKEPPAESGAVSDSAGTWRMTLDSRVG